MQVWSTVWSVSATSKETVGRKVGKMSGFQAKNVQIDKEEVTEELI